jgi:hypothetical protein
MFPTSSEENDFFSLLTFKKKKFNAFSTRNENLKGAKGETTEKAKSERSTPRTSWASPFRRLPPLPASLQNLSSTILPM